MSKLKIAIIGSGISGLSAAWLLSNHAEVSIFEKNKYLGGHTNTITIQNELQKKIDVDTGFIVFNRINYPNFSNFLDYLGVKTYKSDMSFSASINNNTLEYSGKSLKTIFAQKKNILNLSFWKMLFDIVKFFNNSEKDIPKYIEKTIEDYLIDKKYSKEFRTHFLYPMAASIWSTKPKDIKNYPHESFVNFFKNHGLLKFFKRPQWETINGGSRNYIQKIISENKFKYYLNEMVLSIEKKKKYIELETKTQNFIFDHVIFANHADETLNILKKVNLSDKKYLSEIKYQKNTAFLHSDENLMPRNFDVWSSWNYISSDKNNLCVTYWMNLLQNLNTEQNIFVTLNPTIHPKKEKTFRIIHYSHPKFDMKAIKAQKYINNNSKNIWFCGAYLGYGFHEDGINSGLKVAEEILGLKRPWKK